MNCKDIQNSLIDIIDGSPESIKIEQYHVHIRSCTRCRNIVQKVSESWNKWDPAAEIEVPPNFYHEIVQKIEHNHNPLTFIEETMHKWQLIVQPAIAILLIIAGIRLGAYLGTGQTQQHADTTKVATASEGYYDVFDVLPTNTMADYYYGTSAYEEETVQ
ncbi:MAG: hypothetical protein GF401_12375 [Chitinivibrionales bacterium]|nr:hypothetical protein [Chitinivibrionales bacterium]